LQFNKVQRKVHKTHTYFSSEVFNNKALFIYVRYDITYSINYISLNYVQIKQEMFSPSNEY